MVGDAWAPSRALNPAYTRSPDLPIGKEYGAAVADQGGVTAGEQAVPTTAASPIPWPFAKEGKSMAGPPLPGMELLKTYTYN